jgi:hypothetical protein
MTNVYHPDIFHSVLDQIVPGRDVIGCNDPVRAVLAVTVDNWLMDELGVFGTDSEQPDEDDSP